MAKLDDFSTKIAINVLRFSQFRPTKGIVPDLVALLEHFFGIPIGRTQFYKIFTFKIEEIEI